ncbi:hypothetical protein Ccrd_004896 [Cynara cardunculus var. scolymus]|uniref:Uncharacterized protein n=2 Tax=Cynara cardunculus var. scolymus TaxID=59895 RepID=A0A124SC91_CYNCS|nr:hypothetical protein Ccrd_004896 [Cynara cardunculus var. scolymus]
MTVAAAIRPHRIQANVVDNAIHMRRKSFAFELPVMTALSPSSGGRRFIIAASKSSSEEANSGPDGPDLPFTSQVDLKFLLKLGAGSFMAAAAIKYGSILVPEITQPNITQALIMISTPVLVSLLILIKESRVEQ